MVTMIICDRRWFFVAVRIEECLSIPTETHHDLFFYTSPCTWKHRVGHVRLYQLFRDGT
jgi:hypothetical protein